MEVILKNHIDVKDVCELYTGMEIYLSQNKDANYPTFRKRMNEFANEHLGRKWGENYEKGIWYINSSNPSDIKQYVCDLFGRMMEDGSILYRNLQRAAKNGEELKAELDDFGEYYDIVNRNKKQIRKWLQKWMEEPAFNIKKYTERVRPTEEGRKYILPMFEHLKELGYIDRDSDVNVWNYICGVSDNPHVGLLKFNGNNLAFAILLERFFAPFNSYELYFDIKNKPSFREFVSSFFLNENGKAMNYQSVKSHRSRFQKNIPSDSNEIDEIWNKMKVGGM